MGEDFDGVTMFFSEKALKENKSCIGECGYIEAEIKFKKIVQPRKPRKYSDS